MNKNNKKTLAGLVMVRLISNNLWHFFLSSMVFFLTILIPVAWLLITTPNFFDTVAIALTIPCFAALLGSHLNYIETADKSKFNSFADFFKAFKKSFKDTIKYCLIYAIMVFVVLFNINHFGSEMPLFQVVLLAIAITVTTLIAVFMMLISTRYQFRLKDLVKVSIYSILMHFKITLKVFAVFVVLFFASPWVGLLVILLFVSPIVYLIALITHPVLADVYEVFVEKPEE